MGEEGTCPTLSEYPAPLLYPWGLGGRHNDQQEETGERVGMVGKPS